MSPWSSFVGWSFGKPPGKEEDEEGTIDISSSTTENDTMKVDVSAAAITENSTEPRKQKQPFRLTDFSLNNVSLDSTSTPHISLNSTSTTLSPLNGTSTPSKTSRISTHSLSDSIHSTTMGSINNKLPTTTTRSLSNLQPPIPSSCVNDPNGTRSTTQRLPFILAPSTTVSPALPEDPELDLILLPVRADLDRLSKTTVASMPPSSIPFKTNSYFRVLRDRLVPIGKCIIAATKDISYPGAMELRLCQYIAQCYWPLQTGATTHLRIMEMYRNALYKKSMVPAFSEGTSRVGSERSESDKSASITNENWPEDMWNKDVSAPEKRLEEADQVSMSGMTVEVGVEEVEHGETGLTDRGG